jgi:hypothetical protein
MLAPPRPERLFDQAKFFLALLIALTVLSLFQLALHL